jgi:predicted N-acetyltransferase YhbS
MEQAFSELWYKMYDHYGLVNFDCSLFIQPRYMVLDAFIVKTHERKKGVGSSAMKELIELADNHLLTIYVEPSSIFGTPKDVLIKFYSKFGFKKIGSQKGVPLQYKNYMQRKPNIPDYELRS